MILKKSMYGMTNYGNLFSDEITNWLIDEAGLNKARSVKIFRSEFQSKFRPKKVCFPPLFANYLFGDRTKSKWPEFQSEFQPPFKSEFQLPALPFFYKIQFQKFQILFTRLLLTTNAGEV